MRIMKSMLVACFGIVALFYLLNIGAGVIELIPDNMPFVGNLDEGGAVLLLLMCLRYFGMDLTKLFENSPQKKPVTEKQL